LKEFMRGYKAPGFQDRTAAARDAKQKALDQLRDKPPERPQFVNAKPHGWPSAQKLCSKPRQSPKSPPKPLH
jgi:hypothetical protein